MRGRPGRVCLLIFAVVSNGVEPVRRQGERPATARSTALEESIMTASYAFDVFTSLDGFGSYSGGNWGGYRITMRRPRVTVRICRSEFVQECLRFLRFPKPREAAA